MSADAGDFSLFEDDNFVGVFDGVDALGDDEDDRIFRDWLESGAEKFVGFHVESGERVVKKIDFWMFGDGTGDAETLFLAAAEVVAAFGDVGVEFFGEFVDEIRGLGNFGCGFEFILLGARDGEGDV